MHKPPDIRPSFHWFLCVSMKACLQAYIHSFINHSFFHLIDVMNVTVHPFLHLFTHPFIKWLIHPSFCAFMQPSIHPMGVNLLSLSIQYSMIYIVNTVLDHWISPYGAVWLVHVACAYMCAHGCIWCEACWELSRCWLYQNANHIPFLALTLHPHR